MSVVEETIEVNVPVRTAYDQWTQFEEFPKFMEAVKSVRQTDDTHLEWEAEIAGRDKKWRAEIIEQEPDKVISWRSLDGARNDGVVRFEPIDESRTRINLRIDADPEGPIENIGDALGFLKRQVREDLERFKEFIEKRGTETGAWRGEVHGGGAQPNEATSGDM
ncbi:MAG: hypothetical protein QOH61_2813 [Chloroflexota bacterium]|jgi:uncharacterized membrane protein|nr:hypothetical protein [Chloroflexota bacterium]